MNAQEASVIVSMCLGCIPAWEVALSDDGILMFLLNDQLRHVATTTEQAGRVVAKILEAAR